MITHRRLVQGLLAAVILFSQTWRCQAQPTIHYKYFEIVGYDVDIGRGMLILNDIQPPPVDALIRCHGKNGEEIDIVFLSVGTVSPANVTHFPIPGNAELWGRIYVSRDAYVWFVDAIRNEKCIATLCDNDPSFNKITFSGLAGWGHGE